MLVGVGECVYVGAVECEVFWFNMVSVIECYFFAWFWVLVVECEFFG